MIKKTFESIKNYNKYTNFVSNRKKITNIIIY